MSGLTLIVAASQDSSGIGLNGGLPWRLPADLKYFKDVTTANRKDDAKENEGKRGRNAVIMGRKTWDSIPSKVSIRRCESAPPLSPPSFRFSHNRESRLVP